MYDLYVEKCQLENLLCCKKWAYRQVFNTRFNLSFHPPRKDTCKQCDIFKAQSAVETTEHEVHLRKAELARASLNSEQAKGSADGTYDAISFDLEKVISLPKLTTNEVYYCRQLSTFNLGIHSLTSAKGHMYVWDESTASRGADEVGSCLLHYCQQKAAEGVHKVAAYSDSCGGQNRNHKIALMWLHIVQTTPITQVDHKFMVSGHSYLPNDRDFGVIERAVNKATDIYVPEHFCKLVEKCNKANPFKVVRMEQNLFFSTKLISNSSTNRKISESNRKVEWLKMQWMQFRKEAPQKLFFKYSLNDEVEFDTVSFIKRGRQLVSSSLTKLHEQQRPLAKEKLADIRKLLKYVPPVYHNFYENLREGEENTDSESQEVAENDQEQVIGRVDRPANSSPENTISVCSAVDGAIASAPRHVNRSPAGTTTSTLGGPVRSTAGSRPVRSAGDSRPVRSTSGSLRLANSTSGSPSPVSTSSDGTSGGAKPVNVSSTPRGTRPVSHALSGTRSAQSTGSTRSKTSGSTNLSNTNTT
jgi:hypothetical protein